MSANIIPFPTAATEKTVRRSWIPFQNTGRTDLIDSALALWLGVWAFYAACVCVRAAADFLV
jgi:hypothetical protein